MKSRSWENEIRTFVIFKVGDSSYYEVEKQIEEINKKIGDIYLYYRYYRKGEKGRSK